MIKAICTQFRNEKNKIKDWLIYNIEEGFNTFILFDDYSDDNSKTIVFDTIEKTNKPINLIYKLTDKNNEKIYDNCLSTEIYQNDQDLHRRVARSFLSGFEIFKSMSNSSNLNYCAFIDIDEVLISNQKEKITIIVEDNFLKKNVEHLYVQSYDVNTNGIFTDDNIFFKESTKYRWSNLNRETFLDGKYKYRGKSIVTDKHKFECSIWDDWSIIHCGGCIGSNFETAIPINSNKVPLNENLRINHYRIPPNDRCEIFEEYDEHAFNRLYFNLNKK